MLECKEIRPMLPDYAAGRLEEDVAAQVAEHLLLCPICAEALEVLRTEAYRAPEKEARSFATQDPLAGMKNEPAPAEEAENNLQAEPEAKPAPDAAVTELVKTPKVARKKPRLRRRNKVLLALFAVLVVLGACVGILYSREVFAIGAKETVTVENTDHTAVMYQGISKQEKNGFRIRLRIGDTWASETAFYGMEYSSMQWSPDGRFLAVAFLEEGFPRIHVIDRLQEAVREMKGDLERYLESCDGYMGDMFLAGIPACTPIGWLPDGSALLVAATLAADSGIDPHSGVVSAKDWDLSGLVGTNTQKEILLESHNALTVIGYFTYFPETGSIEHLIGFEQRDEAAEMDRLVAIAAEFRTTGMMDYGMVETYYQTEALIELAKLPDYCRIEGITYRLSVTTNLQFTYESWAQLRATITEDSGIILLTDYERTTAYVIVVPAL